MEEKVLELLLPLTKEKIKFGRINRFEKSHYMLPNGVDVYVQPKEGKNFGFEIHVDKKKFFSWHGSVMDLDEDLIELLINGDKMQGDGSMLFPFKIIDIDKTWFKLIESGEKRVEGKKGSPSWIGIKQNDYIFFRSEGFFLRFARVVEVRKYSTIRSYLEQEGLRYTLPGIKTVQEGIDIYTSPPISWTDEEVKKYGVLAIEVDINTNN